MFPKCWCNTIVKIPQHKHALSSRVKSSEVCMCGYFLHHSSVFFSHGFFFFCHCTNCSPRIEAFYCSDTRKTQKICWSWTSEWPKLCNTKGPHAAPATSHPREPFQLLSKSFDPQMHLSAPKILCKNLLWCIFNKFSIGLLSSRYFKLWWCKV